MSAKNHTFCPRCIEEKQCKIEKMETALSEEYGKLPREEWLDKRKLLIDLKLETYKQTLREDYEIWMEGKENPPRFFVQYSCSCENCGFEYSFAHEEVVSIKVENDGQ